jgi:hypothetical protein
VRCGANSTGPYLDKEVVRAVPGPTGHLDFKTHPRVEWIVDANQLYTLFAGSM